jgi:predicted HAD superfamily Cof-like phosphohydrolase
MSHLSYYDNTQEKAKLLNMTVTDMVTEFADLTSQAPNPELYEKLIAEEYDEWSKEVLDAHNELKELSDLVYVCYGYAKAKDWNLDEAIRRVHRNNVGRCLQPDGTVKRREDGKILKNPNFPKVDLKGCL